MAAFQKTKHFELLVCAALLKKMVKGLKKDKPEQDKTLRCLKARATAAPPTMR